MIQKRAVGVFLRVSYCHLISIAPSSRLYIFSPKYGPNSVIKVSTSRTPSGWCVLGISGHILFLTWSSMCSKPSEWIGSDCRSFCRFSIRSDILGNLKIDNEEELKRGLPWDNDFFSNIGSKFWQTNYWAVYLCKSCVPSIQRFL